jgi:hypothetical protein
MPEHGPARSGLRRSRRGRGDADGSPSVSGAAVTDGTISALARALGASTAALASQPGRNACHLVHLVRASAPDDDSVKIDTPPVNFEARPLAELPVDDEGGTVLGPDEALGLDVGAVEAGGDAADLMRAESPTFDDQSMRDEPTGGFIVRLNDRVSFRANVGQNSGPIQLREVLICADGQAIRPAFTLRHGDDPGRITDLTITTLVDGAPVAESAPLDVVVP